MTVVVAAGALACSLVAVEVTGAATRAPSLRLLARQPLTVTGKGFGPLERVRLVASWESGKAMRRTRATHAGAFLVRFRSIRLGRCEALRVSAVGSRGSRAVLEPRQPACLPA